MSELELRSFRVDGKVSCQSQLFVQAVKAKQDIVDCCDLYALRRLSGPSPLPQIGGNTSFHVRQTKN